MRIQAVLRKSDSFYLFYMVSPINKKENASGYPQEAVAYLLLSKRMHMHFSTVAVTHSHLFCAPLVCEHSCKVEMKFFATTVITSCCHAKIFVSCAAIPS